MAYLRGLFVLALAVTALSSQLGAYDAPRPDSVFRNTAGVDDRPKAITQEYGVLEETPNQRRLRLGETIAAAEQASESDYGVRIKTPNERRKRWGFLMAAREEPDYGVRVETPNERRARLGEQMPWDGERGVLEETPNQRRARLSLQEARKLTD